MTTTAALIAEVRKLDAEATDTAQEQNAAGDRACTLLPQLAGALEAWQVATKLCAEHLPDGDHAPGCVKCALEAANDDIFVQTEARNELRDALKEARASLAKVRERAIYRRNAVFMVCTPPVGCGHTWRIGKPEQHYEDCPARPMEGA